MDGDFKKYGIVIVLNVIFLVILGRRWYMARFHPEKYLENVRDFFISSPLTDEQQMQLALTGFPVSLIVFIALIIMLLVL